MKKIIFIAFAAILAGFAISCQKEEIVSGKTDNVQYSFNITVNDQVGFDNGASTKGGSSATYKTSWENGDRIFLFFNPTDESLLTDTYATLRYDGSAWEGSVTGSTSLGEGGTLSAVYVYKLDGNVTPAYSDSKWTIATGNTFYNCQIDVSYTVSGDVISSTLNLVAPANFVQFYLGGATGVLTCDKVKGWKDVAIGSDMTVSNVTCTGYMEGLANSGDSNVKEYYGRIVSGTSLNGVPCEFSVVKNGKVYERTATPSSDGKSFSMNTSATGDKEWTEAAGKLTGVFTVKAATSSEPAKQVRFSKGNLVATIDANGTPTEWKFATNQYNYLGEGGANKTIGNTAGDVDLFGWSASNNGGTSTTDNYGIKTSTSYQNYSGDFYDWGKAIGDGNTWRTLTTEEWQYLINKNDDENIRKGKYKYGVTVCDKTNCLILAPDDFTGTIEASYDAATWASAEAAGLVCLPAAGNRSGSNVSTVGSNGRYWSSTAIADDQARLVFFGNSSVNPVSYGILSYGFSVRLITECQ